MLFPYIYVPHQMEKMQEFIDYIFFDVWCEAPIGLEFHPDLFDCNPDLKSVISAFGFASDPPKRGNKFYKDVKAIYESFADLSSPQIDQLKLWYEGNNDLEKVCANDPATQIVRYVDVAKDINKELVAQLKSFFTDLYSHALLNLAALRAKIGNIYDHYQEFSGINYFGKCPFCGLYDLMGKDHGPREAYDHYFPKSLYPFNSINFKNLVPACHVCNSSYKTSKDPAYIAKNHAKGIGRREVFYPFATASYAIDLQVSLAGTDFEKFTPSDIKLHFGPVALANKIDTWKDVYGIDERYKAKLCSESDGKYWIVQVLDEWGEEDGQDPIDFLNTLSRQAKKNPHAECNFLKKPFLDACEKVGMFSGV